MRKKHLSKSLEFWKFYYDLYIKENKSIDNISIILGVSSPTIRSAFTRLNLELKPHNIRFREAPQRRRETWLKKYGVENPSQLTVIKEKKKKTLLKNYGVTSPLCSSQILQKQRKTMKKRYGDPDSSDNQLLSKRRICTRLKSTLKKVNLRLSEGGYILLDDYKGMQKKKFGNFIEYFKYKIKHEVCNTIFKDDVFALPRCPKCFPVCCSRIQSHYVDFIKSFGITIQMNKRDIILNKITNRYFETDIYLSDLKVAFEINGAYYHSSYFQKDKLYHQQKTDLALEQGIKLYHIWDYQNQDIIKSKIKQVLGISSNKIGARSLSISLLDKNKAKLFFNKNHLHGNVRSSFVLGLIKDDEIYSAISFRKHKEGLEIARFASLMNYTIPGAFSRLFKHSLKYIKDNFNPLPHKIITYASKDWSPNSQETVYAKTEGFKFVCDTGPSLFYTDNKNKFKGVYPREKLQKHKLKKLFPNEYNQELTADQILSLVGIYSIHDSGNWRYDYSL